MPYILYLPVFCWGLSSSLKLSTVAANYRTLELGEPTEVKLGTTRLNPSLQT